MAKRSRGRLTRMRSLRMVRRPPHPSWHLAFSGLVMLSAIVTLLYTHWQISPPSPPPPEPPPKPAADALALAEILYGEVEPVLEELGIGPELVGKVRSPGQLDRIEIRIPADLPLSVVNLQLTRFVQARGGKVLSATDTVPGRRVEMHCGFDQTGTTLFSLVRHPGLHRQTGRIAIVIDDFGGFNSNVDRRLGEWFSALPHPLTFAVLPNQGSVGAILELAEQGGHEVILHLPMEPNDPAYNPGKGAIRVEHTEAEIRRQVREALGKVVSAVGVNNHMGSKATTDWRVMEHVLRELKSRDLFFLDSRTSEHSIAYDLAHQLAVPALKRDLFIDLVDNPAAIEAELWELAALAGHTGRAIGIGHNRQNTLLALQAVLPRLETRGFALVRLSALLR